MTRSDTLVQSSWTRIDTCLQSHAPTTFAELDPPATADEIATAQTQTQTGLRFPAELLESLACHNGAERYSGVLPGNAPLGAAQMVELWRLRVETSQDDNPQESFEDDGEPWWHPEWIPWAATDGDALVIDMRSGVSRAGSDGRRLTTAVGSTTTWPGLRSAPT